MKAPLLLPLALLAGCATTFLTPPDPPLAGTSGRFDRWNVRDAVAVRDQEGISVIFAWLGFDRRAWVEDAQLSPEDMSGSSFFMLKQRMNTPYVERILGGALDGDTAWVDFSGSEGVIGHSAVTGTAVMKRDRKGRWRVDRYVTQDVPEDDEPEDPAQGGQAERDAAGSHDAPSVFIGGNVHIR